jgi:hypothetical protein
LKSFKTYHHSPAEIVFSGRQKGICPLTEFYQKIGFTPETIENKEGNTGVIDENEAPVSKPQP